MSPTGQLLVGFSRVSTPDVFKGKDAANGRSLEPPISIAGPKEVARACALADAAFDTYRHCSLELRAQFLERCAENIEGLGETLLDRARSETGLSRARLEGERARTVGQLRLFVEVVRQGDWLGLRIDPAKPGRKPQPRSDLRQRKVPLGPVAVFGASNFPLAFSAAGGDTASALAAGCPVVVKAHPAHPGTSELAASAVSAAAQACGLPDGVFSHLSGPRNELGAALVSDPRIKAVGFTGSRGGGLALMKLAAARPEPIPVYAEMSSVNPVLLLPDALKQGADALASAFVASLTLGMGQFCTNPGLVFAVEGPDLDRFLASASRALAETSPAPMLTESICENYRAGVTRLDQHGDTSRVARSGQPAPDNGAALFVVDMGDFLDDPALAEEVFGPAALVVRCRSTDDFAAALQRMEGQLTATLHLAAEDHAVARSLIPLLERRVGRILVNGWPTGVEVSPAMVHGGPYPATSDSRSTSVGTLAIERFLRPVCYQDFPDDLLSPELQRSNPLSLRRLTDGKY
ncbi:MAG TPA: aldehyde dehydrogenase (NADP(+)) [Rhizomicrobium sp.]|nr:aldehyde dehydrogenase (NADP(+)) [Rhizomicrobium sp.]